MHVLYKLSIAILECILSPYEKSLLYNHMLCYTSSSLIACAYCVCDYIIFCCACLDLEL